MIIPYLGVLASSIKSSTADKKRSRIDSFLNTYTIFSFFLEFPLK